jgi:hypothetical protein
MEARAFSVFQKTGENPYSGRSPTGCLPLKTNKEVHFINLMKNSFWRNKQ